MALRALLRESTAPAHTEIEKNRRLSLLTSSALDKESYRDVLARYYGFFRPIENALSESPFANVVPNLHERFKSAELTQDLLGLGLTAQDIEALPFATQLPPVQTRAQILGVMYVLEGSALGGMMIARGLTAHPWWGGGSFFHSDGAAVSSRWKSYLAALETVPESEWPEVVSSALATFKALDHWMGS